jgi:hypothetical protein
LAGFRAIVLNFLLTIRISNERAEIPATSPGNLPEVVIFRRSFDWRPAAEKIRPQFGISTDSFVLAADKRRISLTIS